ncbi:hypothetical protein NBRC3278_2371 [Acetobacter pasteurianus NBRC 3278]|uniref:Uncharacterized protein n=1 Tax=Acetobacter pasteurianus NBRC 3278 TaxID=1226660 RepID=A0A401X6H3_ACEPA|nr:hypothetical protein NBRC3278_2371 [Acetobacter pasteurianus NBRC 3278]
MSEPPPLRLGYAILHRPHCGAPHPCSKGMVIITIPAEAKGVTMMVMPSTTDFPRRGHKPHDAVFSY